MRLLILGGSDSSGEHLPNFADSWRERLREELPALLGEEVEVFHRKYYTYVPGPLDYLERCLADARPDFVILGANGWEFATPSVANRLRRLFGKTAGDWFERRFESFDAATLGHEGRLRRGINRGGHAVAGVVGREPTASYESVLQTYLRTIDRLARQEDLDAIVMGTTYLAPELHARLPKMRSRIIRFNAALRAEAERRHFGWLDKAGLVEAQGRAGLLDPLHRSAATHRVMADAFKAMIAERAGART